MNKKRIVIVEDESIIAEDIKRTLQNFGYDVIRVFSCGEDILEHFIELDPDLILMDVMLAGDITGIEAAAQIHATKDIPIIYLTAYANENIISEAKITGPFGYLIKPFEERELHATIEMAFYRFDLEERIRINEIKYRTLFNSIADPIFIYTKQDFSFLDCNDFVSQIYGYDRAEILQMSFSNLQESKEFESWKKTISMKNYSDPSLFHHHKKNGEVMKVIIYTNEILYGKELAWISIVHDITAHDKAEHEFHKTQSRLATIFQNVPNIILYEVGENHHFISENVNRLLDLSAPDFLKNKLDFCRLIHPEDKPVVESKIRSWQEEDENKMLTLWYRVQHAHGHFIWIEDRMIKIDPQDETAYITGVIIDNSDLKKVETDLKKSRSRYRAIVEDQTEFICRFSAEFILTFANNAYCNLIGRKCEDVTGLNGLYDLPPSERENLSQLLKKLNPSQPTTTYEFWYKNPSNKKIYTEWTFRAIYNEQAEFIEYQAVGKDATSRKIAEMEQEKIREQLYQSQKMEVVGRLAGGIAHDFNNLLTAINGYADLALKKIENLPDAQQDIQVIKECGMKAARLTQQLLGFSRKQIVEKKVIDLNQIISELNQMMLRLIGEEISMAMELTKHDCLVLADTGQIEQVLVNLLVNARDALPKGGKITIGTSQRIIDESDSLLHHLGKAGLYELITVEDNGIGIPSENLDRIFEPFFTTKELGKGTGLGLATVFGIIKQNDGHIEVESTLGKGTKFTIYLPAIHAEPVKSKAKQEKQSCEELPHGSETILLVEDETVIREFVSSILDEFGYDVLEAADGEAGLELAASVPKTIHLLLTDIRMPKMSGPELAEKVRKL
ncbi:MAG TPA: PAS domain S-box protein, partial [Candidatus Cloacimonadota bacterium]|nr:PAS domain S-box protein [Candidatus Cloacimonadota bacterium]